MASCGYRTGLVWDAARSNWQNTGDRPIAWSAWYPSDDKASPEHGPQNFFELGNVIPAAALVLSHLGSGLSTHLGRLSFEGHGAFAT